MKALILNNWEAKLVSLVLASVLWFLIKKNIETPASEADAMRAPLVETPTDASHKAQ